MLKFDDKGFDRVVLLMLALSFMLLIEGNVTGDQKIVLEAVNRLVDKGGLPEATGSADEGLWYAGHQLLWSLILLAGTVVYKAAAALLPALNNHYVYEAALGGLQAAFALGAVYLTYRLSVRAGRRREAALLLTAALWVASYGNGLLTGGRIECAMCVLVLLRVHVQGSPQAPERRLLWLLALDALLVLAKIYALGFALLAVALVDSKDLGRRRVKAVAAYAGALILLVLCIYAAKAAVLGFEIKRYALWMDPELAANSSPFFWAYHIASALFDQLFSFSYGLVFTFPAVLLLAFHPRGVRAWLPSAVPLVALMAVFSLNNQWHGATGIAGGRYLFPFALWLLPHFIESFGAMLRDRPRLVALVPLLALLFLPAINYRHNLVVNTHYYFDLGGGKFVDSGRKHNKVNNVPYYEPFYQPGVFAWAVVYNKALGRQWLLLPEGGAVRTGEVVPVTAASRLSYLNSFAEDYRIKLQYQGRDMARLEEALRMLKKMPDPLSAALRGYGYVVLGAWALLLLFCVRQHRRGPG